MFKDLGTALKARFDASPEGDTLRGKVNGLFPTEVGQGTATPYITYSLIGTDVEYSMAPTEINDVTIQFSLWDDDPSPLTIVDAANDLVALFQDVLLTVTGHSVLLAKKASERLLRDPDEGWQMLVDFRFLVGK